LYDKKIPKNNTAYRIEIMKTKESLQKGYRYIFGPVPSRRLGLSLGIDLLPHKTCTLDCVYCECGKTTHLTTKREAYVETDAVIREVRDFLKTRPVLDYITFSGSGEPTLHEEIGEVIRFLKSEYPEYAVCLLTNGTLFDQPQVREAVVEADLIIASIDAGCADTFKTVNRPHPRLDFPSIIEGLVKMGEDRKHALWIECFIIPEVNDSEREFFQIKTHIGRVHADKVQLNTLDRPGTESWVTPASPARLRELTGFLMGSEIIPSAFHSKIGQPDESDLHQRIFATLRRRPSTLEDLSRSLGMEEAFLWQHICTLLDRELIEKIHMPRGEFLAIKGQATGV
jgi:wyosine [tRNA(Phe)-imidazoG37] synthetase (radical SAM superfamily)